MTRINLIEPDHLTERHLIAEYKEITQFLHLVRKRIDKNDKFEDIPQRYTLSNGHCKFFFDKGLYLYKRFHKIYKNMVDRGINVNFEKYNERVNKILYSYGSNNSKLWNDYAPDTKDYRILLERVDQRIKDKPHLYPDADRFYKSYNVYFK